MYIYICDMFFDEYFMKFHIYKYKQTQIMLYRKFQPLKSEINIFHNGEGINMYNKQYKSILCTCHQSPFSCRHLSISTTWAFYCRNYTKINNGKITFLFFIKWSRNDMKSRKSYQAE